MERGHHPGVARGEAEWEVAGPGQVPAVTAFARVVERRCPTLRERPVIT